MKAISIPKFIAILSAIAISSGFSFAQDSAPKPRKTVAPELSHELRNESGSVWLLAYINKYGFVIGAEVNHSTNNALNDAAINAIHRWIFEPARKDGRQIASQVIQPFEFSDGAIAFERKSKKDRQPKPIFRMKPEIPEELANINGKVTIKALVDPRGGVPKAEIIETTHNELSAYAIKAARKWKFRPAIREGKPAAMEIIIPFHFIGEATEELVSKARFPKMLDRAPKPMRRQEPSIPADMKNERAEAKILLYIDKYGFVADNEVIESTNGALAQAAAEATLNWTFKPAFKDGLPVESKIIQPFKFNGGVLISRKEVDRVPRIRQSPKPELPEALQGVNGYVNVLFQLDRSGNVVHATTRDSSHEELIKPTLEAAQKWKFKPAVKNGEDVDSSVIVPFKFGKG